MILPAKTKSWQCPRVRNLLFNVDQFGGEICLITGQYIYERTAFMPQDQKTL